MLERLIEYGMLMCNESLKEVIFSNCKKKGCESSSREFVEWNE